MSMNIQKAEKKLLAFLQAEHLKRGGSADFEAYLYRWPYSHLAGVRVAEMGWASSRAGAAYMQSDIPHGLLVCAAAERLLLDYCAEDDEEVERSQWGMTEVLWPEETKQD